MGIITTLASVFLVVVNGFFLIIGLVFFAFGLFVRFGSAILNGYVGGVKDSLEQSANRSALGTVDLSRFDITDLLFGMALGLIFFGLCLIIITVLGGFAGCYKIQAMLIFYVIVCGVLLIGQIIVIGILYGSPSTFHNPAKQKLKDQIKTYYSGLNGKDVVSMGWNLVMKQINCCGVESYADFTGATNWVIDYSSAGYTLKTPLACCKTLPDSTDFTCADVTGATAANNYFETGCYDKIWKNTLGDTAIMAGCLVNTTVFQLALLVFSIILILEARRRRRNNNIGR